MITLERQAQGRKGMFSLFTKKAINLGSVCLHPLNTKHLGNPFDLHDLAYCQMQPDRKYFLIMEQESLWNIWNGYGNVTMSWSSHAGSDCLFPVHEQTGWSDQGVSAPKYRRPSDEQHLPPWSWPLGWEKAPLNLELSLWPGSLGQSRLFFGPQVAAPVSQSTNVKFPQSIRPRVEICQRPRCPGPCLGTPRS